MIIGVSGTIGSGKDTVADYLTTHHGFRRESFASTLKDIVSIVFGWDRVMMEGTTKSSREWREQVDPWWAQRLDMPKLTPRWVLQYWGTDVLRNHFHDDMWIACLENKLRTNSDNVVITDVRFANEIRAIKRVGGTTVRIHRGPQPEWYDWAAAYNRGATGNSMWATSKMLLDKNGIHPSEYSHVGAKFDSTIDNNGTIDDLHQTLFSLLQDLPAAKLRVAA